MADPIMTPLEEQVMKDYGKYMYKSVDLPNQQQDTGFGGVFSKLGIPSFSNFGFGNAQAANAAELSKNLPEGVYLDNNKLRINPNSKYFGTEGNVLQAIQNDLSTTGDTSNNQFAGQLRSIGMPSNGWFGGFTNASSPFGRAFGSKAISPGALNMLGSYTNQPTTGFGNMINMLPTGARAAFGNFGVQPSMPKVELIEATRTPEEQLQEYLRVQPGMTLDQLKAQIEAKRAAMGDIRDNALINNQQNQAVVNRYTQEAQPQQINDLLNKYTQPQAYARGGEVRGYAEGDLVEKDPNDPQQAQPVNLIPTPNFMPITTGQVEPTGGGATPAPTMAPAMTVANPELNELLKQYTTGADYSADLKQARADRKASEVAFNKSLDTLMSATDEGPSKAEMYWKLASAFGTPTKTGAFGEGLAQAAGAMAETKKEERTVATAKRKLASDIALKKQELALEAAKDQEKTLLGLQSEANKDKREFIKAQVKDFIDSGKPQSNAGKIAKDKGFVPGTKEYQDEVDKQVNLEIEKQLGVINAQLVAGKVALSNLDITRAKEERAAVKLEPDERKAIRDDEDAIHAGKGTIKNLDEALQYADVAFTGTAADQAAYKKLRQTNPTDPRVVATEQLDNLLGVNVIGSLKTTFGGNPTEGERSALKELQGFGSASATARKQIIQRARKALEEAVDYRGARISKIESGGYRKKTEAEGKK